MTAGESGDDHDRDRLRVLCLDYEMAREDERTFQSIQAALVGVAVALTATLSALLTRSGALDEAPRRGEGTHVPESLLVVTPLVPYALIAFAVLLGAVSTIRAYYMRALEADLTYFAGGNLSTLPFPPGRYAELMSELVSVRRGIRWYPYLVLFILIAALLIFGGFVAYIYTGLGTTVARLAMIGLYLPASIFLLVQAGQATIGGRGLFADVARSYLERVGAGDSSSVPHVEPFPDSGKKERSISWYLVIPRPEELPKALFIPLVYIVVSLATGSFSSDSALRAVVIWVAFEYLIYEERYQWNDIRGLHEDYAFRDSSLRRRLPFGDNPPASVVTNVRLSVVVILARLFLAIVLGLAAGKGTLVPILILMAAVAVTAIPYEWLRSRVVDQRISERLRRFFIAAIWAFVGSGYVVRGLTGLWLAGLGGKGELLAIAAVAFGAYGVMFVTLSWGLESLAHSKWTADGSIASVDGNRRKPHSDALLAYMSVPSPPYGESNDLLYARGLYSPSASRAPWNVAFVIAAGFGSALGVGIVGGDTPGGWGAIAAALALIGSLFLIHLEPPRGAAVMVVLAALFAVLGLQVAGAAGPLAAIPWVCFAGLYLSFRNSSYYSFKHWFDDLRIPIESFFVSLVAAFVGRRTLEAFPELRVGRLGEGRRASIDEVP